MSWKRYEEVNSRLNIRKDGIDYSKVLSRELLMILYNTKRNFSYKKFMKSFFLSLDVSEILGVLRNEKTLVTIDNRFERLDYRQLLLKSTEYIKSFKIVDISRLDSRLVINIPNLYWSFKNFKKFRASGFNYGECIFLISRLSFYERLGKDLISGIKRLDNKKCKNYLAFNSSFGIETLFTQVFNTTNIIQTFSLSHGISYINYSLTKPADFINGFNIQANKVFVWGESSKTDLINNFDVDKSKIIIGGNPKYPQKKINVYLEFSKCIVFLGRRIYNVSNFELIKVLSEVSQNLKIDFTLKLHPSLDLDMYKKLTSNLNIKLSLENQSLTEVLTSGNFNFAIAHNTTAYYEAMYFNLPCFRYGYKENEDYFGLNDKFESPEELKNLILRYKSLDKSIINRNVELLLSQTLGMGINNYAEILNN